MLTGDTMQVTADGFVSFMFSYLNLIPLSARAVQTVADAETRNAEKPKRL